MMNEGTTAELNKEMSDSDKLAFLVKEAIANREWQMEVRAWQADASARLAKVEAFVEERSRETRPMLELIVKEVADLNQSVREIRADIREIRADIRILRTEDWKWKREFLALSDRVGALEDRAH
jgi:chromosome segregation ATPase